MARKKELAASSSATRKMRPALSPEAREQQLISLAVDLAEQKLRDGTASSQVIVHYLKLGTKKEELENEKLENEIEQLKAKTKAIESSEVMEKLYAEALKAFTAHGTIGDDEEMEEFYED